MTISLVTLFIHIDGCLYDDYKFPGFFCQPGIGWVLGKIKDPAALGGAESFIKEVLKSV